MRELLLALLATAGAPAAAGGERLEPARPEATLVWYAVPLPYNEAVLAAFAEAHPEIAVETLFAGGAQLLGRFMAEKERGAERADALSSGLAEAFPGLRRSGALADLRSLPNWGRRPAWARDPHGAYYYYASFKVGLMHNARQVSDEEAPRRFAELAQPRWRGRLAVYDLSAGFTVPLFRFLTGPAGLDFAWVARLRGNEPLLAANAAQLDEAIASGRRAAGIARDTEALGASARGAPVRFRLAEEGFMLHLMPVAVNSRAPHPRAARVFVNWLMSDDAHRRLARQGVGLSQLPGAPGPAEAGGWAPDAEAFDAAETAAFTRRVSAALRGR